MTTPTTPADFSGSSSGQPQPVMLDLNEEQIASLRLAGYSDAQIEALLAFGDPATGGDSLSFQHFNLLNKETLNALQYSGNMDELGKELAYLQAPIAMVQEVSDPMNWQGHNYVGPGAAEINMYLVGEGPESLYNSLDALALSVLSARADILQTQLEGQISDIEGKNATLDEGNEMIDRGKAIRDSGGGDMPEDMVAFYRKMGVSADVRWYNEKEWDERMDQLKTKLESLTNQSQLETTKLQQTVNKYNQTYEMLSNFINKYFQSLSTLIQNLR